MGNIDWDIASEGRRFLAQALAAHKAGNEKKAFFFGKTAFETLGMALELGEGGEDGQDSTGGPE